MKELLVTQASGIRQGDPLSPAIFIIVCSVLLPMMKRISPSIHVLFYADDLFLYIPLPPSAVCALLPQTFEHMRIYGVPVGLRLNLGKSTFLVKGMWEQRHLDVLRTFCIQVKQNVYYLGVLVGRVSSEEHRSLRARCIEHTTYTPFHSHTTDT